MEQPPNIERIEMSEQDRSYIMLRVAPTPKEETKRIIESIKGGYIQLIGRYIGSTPDIDDSYIQANFGKFRYRLGVAGQRVSRQKVSLKFLIPQEISENGIKTRFTGELSDLVANSFPIDDFLRQLEAVVSNEKYISPQVTVTHQGGKIQIYTLGFKRDGWYNCTVTTDSYALAPAALKEAVKSKMVPMGKG